MKMGLESNKKETYNNINERSTSKFSMSSNSIKIQSKRKQNCNMEKLHAK